MRELADAFADAMYEKMVLAEEKYGFADEWKSDGWQILLREEIRHHIQKGDPIDVAVYSSFAWFHDWSLAVPQQTVDSEIDEIREWALSFGNPEREDLTVSIKRVHVLLKEIERLKARQRRV